MTPTSTVSVASSPRYLPTMNCQRATGLERMFRIVFLPSSLCNRFTPSVTVVMTPNSEMLSRLKSLMNFV
jgi:hypothetical protein